MDFYERRGLYRLPEQEEIMFSRHYEDRRRERSGKKGFNPREIHYKVRYQISIGKVKLGKNINGEQSYYVIDHKKRKHSFIIVDDKILMTTIYIPDRYQEVINIQKFINRIFLNLVLSLK